MTINLKNAIHSFNSWLNFHRRAYAFGLPNFVEVDTPRWDLALSLCQTPELSECISDVGMVPLPSGLQSIGAPPSTISPKEMLDHITALLPLIDGMVEDLIELQDELKLLYHAQERVVNDFKACQEVGDDELF